MPAGAALPYKPAGGGSAATEATCPGTTKAAALAVARSGPLGLGPGGAPSPNDIEDAIRRLQKNFSGLPGGGLGAKAIAASCWRLLILWLALGTFYTVQPNEVALNLVFGRYTGRALPGLNTNWPWPVGSVIKLPVQDQQITEVGYRTDGRSDVPSESLMLTGDKNIVNVHFRVNWRIDAAHRRRTSCSTC